MAVRTSHAAVRDFLKQGSTLAILRSSGTRGAGGGNTPVRNGYPKRRRNGCGGVLRLPRQPDSSSVLVPFEPAILPLPRSLSPLSVSLS
eukprot:3704661-Pleurochrysis_carterae.AAC.1